VIKRDGISSDAIKQRMANQLDEENRKRRCNFILQNDNSRPLLMQVLELDKQLSTIANEIKQV
jgi:dephospho-CoA kinase